jgi:23S rRNA A1618 N6-methylase RlmF
MVYKLKGLIFLIEVDENSVKSARSNVKRNDLQDQIKIYHNPDRSRILPLEILENEGLISRNDEFAFSMCNPPFYASNDEIQAGLDNKIDDPAAVSVANKRSCRP